MDSKAVVVLERNRQIDQLCWGSGSISIGVLNSAKQSKQIHLQNSLFVSNKTEYGRLCNEGPQDVVFKGNNKQNGSAPQGSPNSFTVPYTRKTRRSQEKTSDKSKILFRRRKNIKHRINSPSANNNTNKESCNAFSTANCSYLKFQDIDICNNVVTLPPHSYFSPQKREIMNDMTNLSLETDSTQLFPSTRIIESEVPFEPSSQKYGRCSRRVIYQRIDDFSSSDESVESLKSSTDSFVFGSKRRRANSNESVKIRQTIQLCSSLSQNLATSSASQQCLSENSFLTVSDSNESQDSSLSVPRNLASSSSSLQCLSENSLLTVSDSNESQDSSLSVPRNLASSSSSLQCLSENSLLTVSDSNESQDSSLSVPRSLQTGFLSRQVSLTKLAKRQSLRIINQIYRTEEGATLGGVVNEQPPLCSPEYPIKVPRMVSRIADDLPNKGDLESKEKKDCFLSSNTTKLSPNPNSKSVSESYDTRGLCLNGTRKKSNMCSSRICSTSSTCRRKYSFPVSRRKDFDDDDPDYSPVSQSHSKRRVRSKLNPSSMQNKLYLSTGNKRFIRHKGKEPNITAKRHQKSCSKLSNKSSSNDFCNEPEDLNENSHIHDITPKHSDNTRPSNSSVFSNNESDFCEGNNSEPRRSVVDLCCRILIETPNNQETSKITTRSEPSQATRTGQDYSGSATETLKEIRLRSRNVPMRRIVKRKKTAKKKEIAKWTEDEIRKFMIRQSRLKWDIHHYFLTGVKCELKSALEL